MMSSRKSSMLAEDAAMLGGDWPDKKPNAEVSAELAWHQLKSRRGWTDATLVILLYEFIKSKGLFGELIKFVGKR
jgi:hypothetical protein